MTNQTAEKPITTSARLWGTRQLSECFGVTEPTIRLWEQRGSIPKAIHIGNKMYWRAEDMEAFLAAR